MQTKQAVQASANVIRITNVSNGDIYKRFSNDNYNSDSVYYGVVKNVHNDGENSIIEAMEYKFSYSSLDVSTKIIRGGDDVVIFPATKEDLNLDFEKARKQKIKEISEKKDEIVKLSKEIKDIDGMISGETIETLREMSYKELTQEQYNTKKIEAGL